MAITAFYASLLAFLFLLLSARVMMHRHEAKIEIGYGENQELLRRSRVHANFAEYVPLALLLIALAESLKAPSIILHVLCLALLAGRVIHAYGLSQTPHVPAARGLGMVLTLAAIALSALMCFVLAGLQLVV